MEHSGIRGPGALFQECKQEKDSLEMNVHTQLQKSHTWVLPYRQGPGEKAA
jgi:hypothetical protein